MTVALPDALPLQFTNPSFNPESLDEVEVYFTNLLELPVDSSETLRAFLKAWNELSCICDESGSDLYVQMACRTEDEEVRARYMALQRDIVPKAATWSKALGQKLLASPALGSLDGTAYAPFVNQIRDEVALFREENLPLQTALQEKTTQYGQISGAWAVEFEGETHTLSAMQKILLDPDRARRELAWRATTARVQQDAEALDTLWEESLALRHQVAQNAGFANFQEYIFAQKRRTFTPEDCFALHEIIEQEVVPLQQEIARWVCEVRGLDSFRPWDGALTPDTGAALQPFSKVEELVQGVEEMMRRLDPQLGELFRLISPMMDLESRSGKSQGGFQSSYAKQRRPFIFANASGAPSDVTTLLHEAGHAFHYLAYVDREPMAEVTPPIEFCEIASMAMELFHHDTLDAFYEPEDKKRAIVDHLLRLPRVLCMVAQGDAFQHWLYTHPEHTAQERAELWLSLGRRFRPDIDTSGLEEMYTGQGWHRIMHFFVVPFYFIEYGFAQLGALQLAVRAEDDLPGVLHDYKHALSLGGQRKSAELYAAAGAEFIPTREHVRTLMQWIRGRLGLI